MAEKPRPSRPTRTPRSWGAPAKPASPPPVIVIRRKGKAVAASPPQARAVLSPAQAPGAPASPATPPPVPAPSAPQPAEASVPSQAAPSPPQLAKKERALAIMRLLMERWSAAFPQDPATIKPLAIGIHREVIERLPEYPPGQIRKAITLWLNPRKGAYLQALVSGGPRYDLASNPRGEVSPEQREQAAKELAAWEAQQKAGRAVGKPASGQ